MTGPKSNGSPYPFGDLLALARQSWLREMAAGLASHGYDDYRRSDAAIVRALTRRPLSISGVASTLGVTRQAARKVVTGLQARGLVTATPDEGDARAVCVRLTGTGAAYARAVVEVIERLNADLAARVGPEQLEATDTVLRAALHDEHTRRLASHLPLPPGREPPSLRRGQEHGRGEG